MDASEKDRGDGAFQKEVNDQVIDELSIQQGPGSAPGQGQGSGTAQDQCLAPTSGPLQDSSQPNEHCSVVPSRKRALDSHETLLSTASTQVGGSQDTSESVGSSSVVLQSSTPGTDVPGSLNVLGTSPSAESNLLFKRARTAEGQPSAAGESAAMLAPALALSPTQKSVPVPVPATSNIQSNENQPDISVSLEVSLDESLSLLVSKTGENASNSAPDDMGPRSPEITIGNSSSAIGNSRAPLISSVPRGIQLLHQPQRLVQIDLEKHYQDACVQLRTRCQSPIRRELRRVEKDIMNCWRRKHGVLSESEPGLIGNHSMACMRSTKESGACPGTAASRVEHANNAQFDSREFDVQIMMQGLVPKIDDADAQALAMAFLTVSDEVLSFISIIDLGGNMIGARGAAWLIRALHKRRCSISLLLCNNRMIRTFDMRLAQSMTRLAQAPNAADGIGSEIARTLPNSNPASSALTLPTSQADFSHLLETMAEDHGQGLIHVSLSRCGLRSLCADGLVGLQGLVSLDLTGTRIESLWSTSEALKGLELRELAFQDAEYAVLDPDFEISDDDMFSECDECSQVEAARIAAVSNAVPDMLSSVPLDSNLRPRNNIEAAVLADVHVHRSNDVRDGSPEPDSELGDLLGGGAINVVNEETDQSADSSTLTTGGDFEESDRHGRSAICLERGYRPFFITRFPNLMRIDGLKITDYQRLRASERFAEIFEANANGKHETVSIIRGLRVRESGNIWPSYLDRFSQRSKRHDLVSSNSETPLQSGPTRFAWSPSLSTSGGFQKEMAASLLNGSQRLRVSKILPAGFLPRQFEYSPLCPDLMVAGTLRGQIVVVNPERQNIIACSEEMGSPGSISDAPSTTNAVLGLCWLNRDSRKFVAGTDSGVIRLFDVQLLKDRGHHVYQYDPFEDLTSLHVNCVDDRFLCSGYSKDIALYDLHSGIKLNNFANCHSRHINVLKFAHSNPFLFASSSFDKQFKLWDLRLPSHGGTMRPIYTKKSAHGQVMICFSPCDQYLLVSAVDNDVKQYLAGDGSLHTNFHLRRKHSPHNYTRSYYMNQGRYIVSGSCEEHFIRLCCTNTGRLLREVNIDQASKMSESVESAPPGQWNSGSEDVSVASPHETVEEFVESMMARRRNVQSLRGNPHLDFSFSVLLTHSDPSVITSLVQCEMLAGQDQNL